MNEREKDYYWDKLSFLITEEDEGYGDELYGVLVEILERIKKLEYKSHMHKGQLSLKSKNEKL